MTVKRELSVEGVPVSLMLKEQLIEALWNANQEIDRLNRVITARKMADLEEMRKKASRDRFHSLYMR